MTAAPKRVLIHRLGSLGDTLITLPVFHLLNRLWPDAEKRVLTNFPVQSKAPPLQTVLGDETFAQGYFAYPLGTRDPRALWSLVREIRRWGPDVAVYANRCRSLGVTLRDRAFLRLCCSGPIHGLPLSAAARINLYDPETGLFEREAARIARTLRPLGDARLDDPANRSLDITAAERQRAGATIENWPGAARFMAFCTGTKWPENDWSDARWSALLADLTVRHSDLGLMAIGAAEDRDRSDRLMQIWRGPSLNLCGATTPRTGAALLARAVCFVGNDSGPMHLAAAAGIPAVAVFSRKNPPGVWFPLGDEHRVFYPELGWSGGRPPVTRRAAGETGLESIPVDQVADACAAFADRTNEKGSSNA